MALYWEGGAIERLELCWYVVVTQAARVEPVLQCRAVPGDTLRRRRLPRIAGRQPVKGAHNSPNCLAALIHRGIAHQILDYLINILNGNDTALDELADWARRSVNAEDVLALHSNTEASLGHLAIRRDRPSRQHVSMTGEAGAGLWPAQSGLREALFGSAEAASRDAAAALDNTSAHAYSAAFAKNLPYDPLRDFIAAAPLTSQRYVLVAGRTAGIATVPELIAAAKATPRELTFASTGVAEARTSV